MTNVTRGALFETVTDFALQEAIKIAQIHGKIFWNKKPREMSIIPDFIIGDVVDDPSHVVLVTAGNSTKNYNGKLWRNLAELQEVKAQLPRIPKVIDVIFAKDVRESLFEIASQVYDSTLMACNSDYFPVLEEWVIFNEKVKFKDKEARKESLRKAISSKEKMAQAIRQLSKELAQELIKENKSLKSLWQLAHDDYKPKEFKCEARPTYVRRGLAKLAVLESEIRELVYDLKRNNKTTSESLPSYPFRLGLLTESIVGFRIKDPDIKSALTELGPDNCEGVIKQIPPKMKNFIEPLRHLDSITSHIDFIYREYNSITNAEDLKEVFKKCYENPSALSGKDSDEKVWVYEIMVSLLKTKFRDYQGYGYARLAEDVGFGESVPGAPLARFIIPKFVQRQKALSDECLRMLSSGLSKRFSEEVSLNDISAFREEMVDCVIKENLGNKLVSYPPFEPLLILLNIELDKQGKSRAPKKRFGGWLNEYTDIKTAKLTTNFIKIKNTLIHGKSAHDSHPSDKAKELCARARNIRYQYSNEKFSRRKEIENLVLIVDGDWESHHLETLYKAGWETIIYPKDIPNFVSSL